jgi:hypothetical protein
MDPSNAHILTTPPVHDDGPAVDQHEIGGGEVAKTGLDSRLREAFMRVADDLAAKNTRVAVAVPVKQLLKATLHTIQDLPRVPDYDAVSAHLARWSEATEYSPTEVPDSDPDSLGVFVRDQGPDVGKVCVEFTRSADDVTSTLDFEDPVYAESFFLAGLAACAYAKAQRK